MTHCNYSLDHHEIQKWFDRAEPLLALVHTSGFVLLDPSILRTREAVLNNHYLTVGYLETDRKTRTQDFGMITGAWERKGKEVELVGATR